VAERRDRALFKTMLGLGLRVGSVAGSTGTSIPRPAAPASRDEE
jgi:hypothetical protein